MGHCPLIPPRVKAAADMSPPGCRSRTEPHASDGTVAALGPLAEPSSAARLAGSSPRLVKSKPLIESSRSAPTARHGQHRHTQRSDGNEAAGSVGWARLALNQRFPRRGATGSMEVSSSRQHAFQLTGCMVTKHWRSLLDQSCALQVRSSRSRSLPIDCAGHVVPEEDRRNHGNGWNDRQ